MFVVVALAVVAAVADPVVVLVSVATVLFLAKMSLALIGQSIVTRQIRVVKNGIASPPNYSR